MVGVWQLQFLSILVLVLVKFSGAHEKISFHPLTLLKRPFLCFYGCGSSRQSIVTLQIPFASGLTTWKLLKLVFLNLDKDELLFDTSPYQFRKRWNLLLATLSIPEDATLTPGGLRGGYAVTAYRHGVSIQNIMLTDCVFERPCWP